MLLCLGVSSMFFFSLFNMSLCNFYSDKILYLLHGVGARRCEAGYPGCNPGCDPNGTFNGEPPEQKEPPVHQKESEFGEAGNK